MKYVLAIPLAFVVAIMMGLVAGFPVKWLWNYTMPGLFHLPEIDFWHAVALIALAHGIFPSGSSGKD